MSKRHALSVLWIAIEKVLKLVVAIMVLMLVARYLGPERYGVIVYLLALVSIVMPIVTVGSNRIISRNIATLLHDKESIKKEVSTHFYLRLIATLITYSVVIALVFFCQLDIYICIAFISILFTPFDVIDFYAQAMNNVKCTSLIRLFSTVTSSMVKLGLVFYEAELIYFVLAIISDYLVAGLLFYCYRRSSGFFNIYNISLKRAIAIFKEGGSEVLAGLCAILCMRLDIIMIDFYLGSASAGVYGAAIRVTEAWYFFPISVVAIALPVFSVRKLKRLPYKRSLLLVMSPVVAVSVLIAGLFFMFSESLFLVLLGDAYKESASVAIISSLSGVVTVFGVFSGMMLAIEKRLILSLYRNMLGLVFNVVLNIIFVKQWGINGAAYATLISLTIAYLLFDLLHRDIRYMFFIKLKSLNPYYWVMSVHHIKSKVLL